MDVARDTTRVLTGCVSIGYPANYSRAGGGKGGGGGVYLSMKEFAFVGKVNGSRQAEVKVLFHHPRVIGGAAGERFGSSSPLRMRWDGGITKMTKMAGLTGRLSRISATPGGLFGRLVFNGGSVEWRVNGGGGLFHRNSRGKGSFCASVVMPAMLSPAPPRRRVVCFCVILDNQSLWSTCSPSPTIGELGARLFASRAIR